MTAGLTGEALRVEVAVLHPGSVRCDRGGDRGAGTQTALAQNAGDAALDGRGTEEQRCGDLAVGPAPGGQERDTRLLGGELCLRKIMSWDWRPDG